MCNKKDFENFAMLLNEYEMDVDWIFPNGQTMLAHCTVNFKKMTRTK